MTVGRIVKNIYLFMKRFFLYYFILFIFLYFFRKPGKLGSHTGWNRWPGDPDVKDDPLNRWPNDPVPCLIASTRAAMLDLLTVGPKLTRPARVTMRRFAVITAAACFNAIQCWRVRAVAEWRHQERRRIPPAARQPRQLWRHTGDLGDSLPSRDSRATEGDLHDTARLGCGWNKSALSLGPQHDAVREHGRVQQMSVDATPARYSATGATTCSKLGVVQFLGLGYYYPSPEKN